MRKLLPLFLLLASAAHAQTVESLMFPKANQVPRFAAVTVSDAQTAIPIQNPSFEVNAVMTVPGSGGAWSGQPIANWTRSGYGAGLWQPASSVFAQVPDGPTIAWVDTYITQDLGVPAQANTTYTLTVFVGHEADRPGSYALSILAGSTVVCTSTGSALSIPLGTFAQISMPCVIGATAPAGNLSLKLASADGSHQLFDNVLLVSAPNTPPPPPPVFLSVAVKASLLWDDGSPVVGSVRALQADATGNFLSMASAQLDAQGNVAMSAGVNVQPPLIALRFVLSDPTGHELARFEQTFASLFVKMLPTGIEACSFTLVKGSNPVSLKSFPVCQP